MDLLFKEYASPFILLDPIIANGEFTHFLATFDKQVEERQLWEFYIHKLSAFDERSFDEFKHDIKGTGKNERPTEKQLETTVKESYELLNNFNPESQKGGAAS